MNDQKVYTVDEQLFIARRVLIRLATSMAEIVKYSWEPDYKLKYSKEVFETLSKQLVECYGVPYIDFTIFTQANLLELGFSLWDEANPIMLIPLWALDFISPEQTVSCIDESTGPLKNYLGDFDIRYGCVAYGIIL